MVFNLIFLPQCWRRNACVCLLWLGALLPAHAHDPFDGNVQLLVFEHKLEAKITLGFDAARASLARAGLTPGELSALKREAAQTETGSARLPLTAAAALIGVSGPDGGALAPSAVHIAFGDMETTFLLIYPRQQTRRVQVRAPFFGYIEAMRPVMVVSANARGKVLARALLTPAQPEASLDLVGDIGNAPAKGSSGMFKLGVEHILSGFDHLLFLAALLLGLHGLRPMLGVLSAFTVAHSMTLALAALDLVRPAGSVVEPLIALSIVVACVHNLRQPDAVKPRYWMAAGFGLIHGFGFAGALRESGLGATGDGLVLPLLAFNVGVEAGQLLVALPAIGVLYLARRHAGFVRLGQPVLSLSVATIGALWLGQRVISG